MSPSYRLLLVEDSAEDAELLLYSLRDAPFKVTAVRVETEPEYDAALTTTPSADIVRCDYLDRHVADTVSDPARMLNDKRFRAELVKHIDELPEREKLLMGLYYEQDLNFREIAAVMNVTESRICQLHTQAVTRLRAKLKNW